MSRARLMIDMALNASKTEASTIKVRLIQHFHLYLRMNLCQQYLKKLFVFVVGLCEREGARQ